MIARPPARGFTLLEAMIALAILGVSITAIFDLNAGAIASHAYVKKVTVASLLARSKMTDIEQHLYDKGFPVDDEEDSGDFSEEGWSGFRWRSKVIAPKTQGVSTGQVLSTLLGVPEGEGGLDGLLSPSGPGAGAPGGGAVGPLAGLAQAQLTQFLEQLSRTVREIHLTVSWKEGRQTETLDLVTHLFSSGPGSDRNGAPVGAPGAGGGQMVNARTGAPVPSPIQDMTGRMVDPTSPNDPVVPATAFQPAGGAVIK